MLWSCGARGTYACSQPLPLACSCARGGQQAGGALRVVLLPRYGGQRLEVVGGR